MIERITLAGSVPMTVTATLIEPIVYTRDGIHLDGILAQAALREMSPERRRGLGNELGEWPADVEIPLTRWAVPVVLTDHHTARLCIRRRTVTHMLGTGAGRLWGWCASAEDVGWLLNGRAEVRKRPELGELARYSDVANVTIGAGALKAYDLTLPTVMAHEIRWYAHGNPDHVRYLLDEQAPALGRKKGIGWGSVSSWHVEAASEDWSIDKDGRLMRRMPQEAGFSGRRAVAAVRPPYFHASRYVPTTEPAL